VHVDLHPRRFELQPGIPQPISVTISNTGSVIGGYAVRVLGADPSWVQIAEDEVSLFPEETRTLTVLVTVPAGMTAGERRISVQVRELTPPEESTVEDVVFTVPEAVEMRLRVDPMAITAGRTARLNLLLDNTGNTAVHQRLHGQDPEGRVRFRFDPEVVRLEPGEHALVDLRATAKQPWMGNLVVRPLELRLVDPERTPYAPEPEAPGEEEKKEKGLAAPSLRRRKKLPPRIADDVPVLASATFVQKPKISRGPISLLGLLLAVTVFAIVITLALSRIVGQSAADRNLALEIAAAREAGGAGSGTSSVAGTVTLLTSGSPVAGVAVSVFSADDTEVPLATTATGDDGAWSVGKLSAGDYKVTFRGAGFVQLWFPQAVDAADAETLTLEPKTQKAGLDVALGGVPASIAGTVQGTDVSASTLTLMRPLSGLAGSSATAAEEGATVMSVPVGDDGSFLLENVPSPSYYDLVVEKPGFATSTQRIDVSAGEERTGVEITLRQGDGVISGVVSSAGGPLGGATIVATSGQTTVTTQSVTDEADKGSFTLRGLPTPASFTIMVSEDEHATQTLSLTLAEGQKYTGVGVTLDSSSGRLTGHVVTEEDEQPATGVLVSVTDGTQVFQTATSSDPEDLGSWRIGGLPLPGDYTVSFSRSDLAPQNLLVSLDGQGAMTTAEQASSSTGNEISVSLRSATAIVEGLVKQRQPGRTGTEPVGEATVTLSSNTTTYTVTTATVPAAFEGQWRLEGIPPGTYTLSVSRNGVSPVSRSVTLAAGDTRPYDTTLEAAASVSGTVRVDGTAVPAGWVVELYRASEYPEVLYDSVRTRGDGSFTFTDVDAPEAYIVQVRRTRGSAASGSTTVQVDTSEAATADVEANGNG
jgi:5-hydroxyisourate hydrolase-like protein (transthyretin family)